jgi:hypothetical protein
MSNEAEKQVPVNGLAIAAMVVGIVAFLSGVVPFWGIIAGITAIILAIFALKQSKGNGFAITGLVTGVVGLLTSVAMTVLLILSLVFGVAFLGAFSEVANEYVAENQAKLDSKKDFDKGETAIFDNYQIKVLAVESYTPDNEYAVAGDGLEFVDMTLEVKNIGDHDELIGPYLFKVRDEDGERFSSYLEADDQIESGEIAPDETVTGSLVYAVKKDSSTRVLTYSVNAYSGENYETKRLTYTLEF